MILASERADAPSYCHLYFPYYIKSIFFCIVQEYTHTHISAFVQYTFFAVPGFYEQAHTPLLKLSSSVGLTNPAAVILDLKGAMNSEGRSVQHRAQ